MQWFVMRDLQRARATIPIYKALAAKRFDVFTPLAWKMINGKPYLKPLIGDILFIHTTRAKLDPEVAARPMLQYRYIKGGGYCRPMVVPTADMERFIHAVRSTEDPVYYTLGEITTEMLDRKIRIVGGILNGYEGTLISVSDSAVKRMLVTLPGFFAAGVKVEDANYVKFV